jgi:hypothetical protein
VGTPNTCSAQIFQAATSAGVAHVHFTARILTFDLFLGRFALAPELPPTLSSELLASPTLVRRCLDLALSLLANVFRLGGLTACSSSLFDMAISTGTPLVGI